jgi:glycosyltransferase involved in cell wall biosynthesis
VRIAVVCQFYPPETGGPSNRLGTFVDELRERGHEIVVVCEQPNHPAGVFRPGFGRRPVITERTPGVTVHRLWVATSPHKTFARRLAFYGSFAAGVVGAISTLPRPEVVFVSSPPLPAALAAGLVASARGVPFVLDVRDIWPKAAEALGELTDPRIVRAVERAERWLYRAAAGVTATTLPFCRHIDAVAGRQASTHLPNGALDSLVALPPAPPRAAGPFTVGYAGNFGIAQGLGIALDAADALRDQDIRFVLVGAGPREVELRAERERRRLDNVEIRGEVPPGRIGALLQSWDALLVPLRDHPALGDFIPSKLYDAMAVGRPVLAAAGREAAALVRQTGCGLVVPPEDGSGLAAAVRSLSSDPDLAARLAAAGRRAAPEYARSRQVERLEQTLRAAVNRRLDASSW